MFIAILHYKSLLKKKNPKNKLMTNTQILIVLFLMEKENNYISNNIIL
jgi:hypothetical protein